MMLKWYKVCVSQKISNLVNKNKTIEYIWYFGDTSLGTPK